MTKNELNAALNKKNKNIKNQRFEAVYSSSINSLLVKISANEYHNYNLIQISKSELGDFYAIMEKIENIQIEKMNPKR